MTRTTRGIYECPTCHSTQVGAVEGMDCLTCEVSMHNIGWLENRQTQPTKEELGQAVVQTQINQAMNRT